jgi:hypothetical protein
MHKDSASWRHSAGNKTNCTIWYNGVRTVTSNKMSVCVLTGPSLPHSMFLYTGMLRSFCYNSITKAPIKKTGRSLTKGWDGGVLQGLYNLHTPRLTHCLLRLLTSCHIQPGKHWHVWRYKCMPWDRSRSLRLALFLLPIPLFSTLY